MSGFGGSVLESEIFAVNSKCSKNILHQYYYDNTKIL